jgi:hypothetical protein
VVEGIPLFLQPFDRDAGGQHDTIPGIGQPLHRDEQLFTGPLITLAEQDRTLWGLRQVKDLRPSASPSIRSITSSSLSQGVNVLPVERRDEGAVQPGYHLVGQLVALMLQPLDRIDDMGPLVDLGTEQIL